MILEAAGVKPVQLPRRSPNLNGFRGAMGEDGQGAVLGQDDFVRRTGLEENDLGAGDLLQPRTSTPRNRNH